MNSLLSYTRLLVGFALNFLHLTSGNSHTSLTINWVLCHS